MGIKNYWKLNISSCLILISTSFVIGLDHVKKKSHVVTSACAVMNVFSGIFVNVSEDLC